MSTHNVFSYAKRIDHIYLGEWWQSIFDYAKAIGYFEGDNPAEWKGNLEPILGNLKQESRSSPSLPYDQIAEFIQHLRQKKGVSPKALEFAILTASLSGDVFAAKWQEIDFKNKVWIIPKERMKAEKEHRVLLSRDSDYIIGINPTIYSTTRFHLSCSS